MVYCGTIVAVKGYEGNIIVSDLQFEVPPLVSGMKVNIGYSEQFSREFTIEEWKVSKLKVVAKIKNIDSNEVAKEYKEMGVFVEKNLLHELDETYIALEDIIGCKLFDAETDEHLGEILEVWETPANKVWLIQYGGQEITIPVIDDVVKSIDIENKKVKISMIEGLLEAQI